MESICADELWDHNLTWGNDRAYPMFTECFQDAVLGTTASMWLLASTPLYLYILYKTKDHVLPRSWLYQAKMGLSVIQIAIRCNEILNVFTDAKELEKEINAARNLAYGLDLIALLASILFVDLERRKNCVTSVVLTIYWSLASLCGITIFYCKTMEPKEDVSSFELVSFQATVACSIIQFILHSFPEPEFYQEGERPSALGRASFVSRTVYSWAYEYLISGYTKTLEDDDFDSLMHDDQAATAASAFLKNWEIEKEKTRQGEKTKTGTVSMFRVLFRSYAHHLVAGNILRVLDLTTDVGRPIIIGCLIGFADDKSEPMWKAFVYLAFFLLFNLGASVNFNYVLYQTHTLAKRMRGALVNAVFQKGMKMSNRSRAEKTVGDMTNLLNEDVEHLKFWIAHFWVVWSVPFEFVFYTIMLYEVVGNAVFVSLAVLILVMPLNSYDAKHGHLLHKERMDFKDNRIKLLTELLNGIKVLKFYAWELAFGDKVLDISDKEMEILRKQKLFGLLHHITWGITPFFIAFATLAAYVYFDDDHVLTARTAFTALAIFGALNHTFAAMPHIFTQFMKAYTSMKRLEEFFNKEEINPDDISHTTSDNAISIEDGQFTWDPKLGACLKDIQLDVKQGSLVAVVGKIGYGKSSLLSAVLGDIAMDKGSVNVNGTTAYVPQQAWIQNATLKNNILFGEKMRKQTYNDVVEACALIKDLEMFPAGDQTEIGEKGINLSGGQKQRVSLARAVYCNADIYLLDDPLSAVDAHVGKHIFDQVIGSEGLLRNKTRILVTHGTTWLPYADKIVVLEDGRIAEDGHFDQLMANDGAFSRFIKEYSLHKSESGTSLKEEDTSLQSSTTYAESGYISTTSSSESDEDTVDILKGSTSAFCTVDSMDLTGSFNEGAKKPRPMFKRSISRVISEEDSTRNVGLFKRQRSRLADTKAEVKEQTQKRSCEDDSGKLIEEDQIEEGTVKLRHLKTYLNAVGPRYCIALFVTFIMSRLIASLGDFNVKDWTSDPELQNLTEISSGSEYRHQKNTYYMKVHVVIGLAKMFFDVIFQLILAFRTVYAADILHRNMLRNVLRGRMSFFDATPVGRIVHRFSSDLEPLDGNLDGSIIRLMDCILNFFKVFFVVSFTLPQFVVVLPPVICAYYYIQKYFVPTRRQISRMRSKRRSPITSHFSEALNGTSVIRAFSKQQQFIKESADKVDYFNELEFMDIGIDRWLSVRLDFLNAGCIAGTVLLALFNRDALNGSVLGLALATAALLHGCLHGFVRAVSEMQKNLVCLEKVEQYSTKETEAALHTSVQPPSTWPTTGDVQIKDFSLRYRDGSDLVLKGINISVLPGERIGIVGRTGAGKSTLMTGLFRLIEPAEGRILIDGYDISDFGLFDLRSHLTILPQDPVLFSGTLKDNLDPLGDHSDENMYNALQHAHLKPFVESLPDKLQYQCGEGGQNLSVGQRQLICLARSLLRKSKILILDEATAAVDMETDELIQTTIKKEFQDCTVLTVAHRLNTIIDYDRILVLDHGEVKEFDKPETLLANSDGIFYSMAKDAGII